MLENSINIYLLGGEYLLENNINLFNITFKRNDNYELIGVLNGFMDKIIGSEINNFLTINYIFIKCIRLYRNLHIVNFCKYNSFSK